MKTTFSFPERDMNLVSSLLVKHSLSNENVLVVRKLTHVTVVGKVEDVIGLFSEQYFKELDQEYRQ
jgi:hypothetical protein